MELEAFKGEKAEEKINEALAKLDAELALEKKENEKPAVKASGKDENLEKMEDVLWKKTEERQKEINDWELEKKIAEAESWEELTGDIEKCKGIQDNKDKHFYSAKYLVDVINLVRSGKLEIKEVPRLLGLRNKVYKFLKKDKQRAIDEKAENEMGDRIRLNEDNEKQKEKDNLKKEIAETKNFEELLEVINNCNGIQGRTDFFSAEDLIKAINFVRREGKNEIAKITTSLGLRQKVYDLLAENEKPKEPEGKKEEESVVTPIDDKDLNINPEDVVEMQEAEGEKWQIKEDKKEENYPLEIIKKTEEERAKGIEQIKAELELARREYLEVDYKKNKAYSRLYKFFGRAFGNKNNEGKNLENDQDIAWYRAHYDNKLMDYKNALLEDAKARGITAGELGEIIKIFETEARINISDGHDQVKLEHHEGRFSGFIKDHSKEIIERYKKLPLAKKIVIGAAFGFGTVAAGATGSALVVGTFASVATLRKFFIGAVTGTTAALYAEAKTQKNREKTVEKETVGFIKDSLTLNPDEMEKMFQEKVNGLIYDGDQKINTIKNKNLRNLGIGIGVGAASAIGLPMLSHHVKEWLGFGPKISDIPGHGTGAGNVTDHSTGPKVPAGETYTENTHHSGVSPEATGKMEMPKEKILTIEKYHTGKSGGTFEGTIKKYLMEEGKLDRVEAGKQATILRQNWESLHPDSHNYDLVHEGDQIKIELDAKGHPYVVDFETADHSGNGGQFSADNVADAKAAPGGLAEELNNQENPKEFSTDEFNGAKSAVPENLPGVSAENPFDYKTDSIGLGETAAEAALASGAIAGGIMAAKKFKGREKKSSTKVEMAKSAIKREYKFAENDDFYSRARKIIQKLSLGKLDNWKKIKDVNFREWEKDEKLIDPKLAKNIKELENNIAVVLGKSAKHKKKENIGQWVARITQSSVKKQMI